ncbi:MAG: ABC transporter permease [Phycisphaerales bacterium]|nr:ABC transporter permease [Phycisphaerales bacterium]
MERAGPVLALILLIAGTALYEYFTVPPDDRAFLTARNFANILGQWSFVGIVAIGMTFVIILGGIDLSVGSMVALAGGVSIYALNAAAEKWPPGVAIAVAIVAGLAIGPLMGLINGIAIAKGRLAPFVATLGTLAIFRSLVVAPAEGSEIRSQVASFAKVGGVGVPIPFLGPDGGFLNVRVTVLIFLGCAIAAHLILSRTVFGRRIYAIGDNHRAARYAGIPIERVTIAVYTIAGFTCGLAGLFNASRLNSVSSSSLGLFYELDAIAAVVIGGTRLQGGSGRIWGTVIGVLIMGVVSNMLNMLGVSNFYHGLVKGVIIMAAVLVQRPAQAD